MLISMRESANKEGRILGMIEGMMEYGMPEEVIMTAIMTNFNITREQAETSFDDAESWTETL